MNYTLNGSEFDTEAWLELTEYIMEDRNGSKHKTYIIVVLIIFVIAIIGNSVTCIVILWDKSLHTPANCYIFNLAVSDLLATFGIVLDVTGQFEQPDKWIHPDFGSYVCKIQYFMMMSLWNNSILLMTVLAVERYLAICHPMKLRSHPYRVKWIVAIVWLMAILVTLPDIFFVNFTRGKNFSICYTIPTPMARKMNGAIGVLTFIVPLAIMLFVYAVIGFKINMTQKHRKWDKTFNRVNNRSKINKLIVALTGAFVVCWLPYFVLRMIIFAADLPSIVQHKKLWCIAYYATGINGWFSAALNPLLFSLISSNFRKSLKALWNKIIRRENKMYRITTPTYERGEVTI